MGQLTGQTIVSTYEQLLKITTEDIDTNANAKYIEDGKATASALSISQHRVGIGTDTPDAILEVEQGASGGQIAFLINNDDADKVAMHIDAANTTADVLDITANALTTSKVIDISATGLTDGMLINAASTSTVTDGGTSTLVATAMTNDGVGSQTAKGVFLDYNKSGVTASGKTANVSGMHIDMDDTATNNASGTVNMTGLDIDVTSANAQGTIKNIGLDVAVAGADTNYAALFSGGNVGIGTDSPSAELEVAGASPAIHVDATVNAYLKLDRGDAAQWAEAIFMTGGVSKWHVGLADSGASGMDGTEFFIGEAGGGMSDAHLVIEGNGNVGLGTTAPDDKLHISYSDATAQGTLDEDDAGAGLQIENTNSSGCASIHFKCSDADGWISYNDTGSNAGNFLFETDGHSIMTMLNGPYVGIGTAAPLDNLHIAGADDASCDVIISSYAGSAGGSDDAGNASSLRLLRARSTQANVTAGSSDALVSDNDTLGAIWFGGFIGDQGDYYTNYEISAGILARVDGDASNANNDLPTELIFYTSPDASGDVAQRMVILPDGNVGIGTDSPAVPFHVSSASDNSSEILAKFSEATPHGRVDIGLASGDGYLTVHSTGGATRAQIHSGGDSYFNGGNLGIGETNPGYPLEVHGNGDGQLVALFEQDHATGDGIAIKLGSDSVTTSEFFIKFIDNSANVEGSISGGGSDPDIVLNDPSDRRLKENIIDIPDAMSIISQIKPRTFKWKDRGSDTNPRYGFIADEWFDVFPDNVIGQRDSDGKLIPDAMTTNMDGVEVIDRQMISTKVVIPVLVKAIQELSAKVTALENA